MQTWEEKILLKQEGEKALLKNQIKKKKKKYFGRTNCGNVRKQYFRSREYYERDTKREASVRNC